MGQRSTFGSIYHLGWGQLHSTPEFDWPLIDGRYFHNGQEKRFTGHCTDFWGAYNTVVCSRRQVCVAHPLRDLQHVEQYKHPSKNWRPFAKKLFVRQ
jgi:hypothetical protein